MKQEIRKVEIHVEKLNKIIHSQCSCPVRAVSRCHHVAMLALYISKNISPTDVPCTWKLSKRPNEEEGKSIAEMYGFEAKRLCIPMGNLGKWFSEELNKRKMSCAMNWYLADEPPSEVDHPAALESLLRSPAFWNAPNIRNYMEDRFHPMLTEEFIDDVAEKTILQFNSTLFCKLRPCRLTACNFGFVIQAISRNSFPKSLFEKILGENWDGNGEEKAKRKGLAKQLIWGQEHEQDARKAVADAYPSWNLKRAGTYLHASGVLSASPDTIITFENDQKRCVLEIKCPYSFADKTIHEGLLWTTAKNTTKTGKLSKNQYIILIDKDGNYLVNEEHEYYHQLQAQMLFSRCDSGFLCLWTPKDTQLFLIEKEHNWGNKNLPILLDFYYNELIPKLKKMYFC